MPMTSQSGPSARPAACDSVATIMHTPHLALWTLCATLVAAVACHEPKVSPEPTSAPAKPSQPQATPPGPQPIDDNPELIRIYREDQADRSGEPDQIDWLAVGPRDHARKARVAEILAAGGARTSDDYFSAAMVYQHGDSVEDFQRAHDLAAKAVELDPTNDTAKWLAAAAEDRYLMNLGKPQRYGTQFRKTNGKWELYQVDPSVTDEERARWGVPPLAEAKRRADEMNQPPSKP